MLFNSIVLAITCNIDAFGIGITYGIKKIKIPFFSTLILFFIAFISAFISVNFGVFLHSFFPDIFSKILGSILFICLGLFVFIKSIKERKNITTNFDKNYDNSISPKESFFLAFAVSLDNFCIGISASIIGINTILFPLLVALFHIISISFGNYLGNIINNFTHLPHYIWSLFSGLLLVLFGIIKLFI